MQDKIVIVSAKRTPIGSFQGVFASLTASELGGIVIKSALQSAKISATDIGEVIMGNVLSSGQGQAPARQAAMRAGLPPAVGATTINKMCGSGMKAIMLAHDMLLAGTHNIICAGGMESMTNAPYLLPRVRQGLRMGHSDVKDAMFLDGLEDAYEKGTLMGVFAERTAEKYGFTRSKQDEFALLSLARAKQAQKENKFTAEITPVEITLKNETKTIIEDELPLQAQPDKIPKLKPAFKTDGTVTAANSSGISDGAAALMLTKQSTAIKMGLPILAVVQGHSTFAHAPDWFTTAPVGAIQTLLKKCNWSVSDVDLFEINEAFSVVTLAAISDLQLDIEKVNIHGGACALGHPIGASGARILCTLISALQQYKLKRGVASLCIGGGEATAIAIEVTQ